MKQEELAEEEEEKEKKKKQEKFFTVFRFLFIVYLFFLCLQFLVSIQSGDFLRNAFENISANSFLGIEMGFLFQVPNLKIYHDRNKVREFYELYCSLKIL